MSIAITWADVILVAPELSALSTDTQDAILADVAEQMSEDVWGTKIDLGAKYLAAHLGTLTRRTGVAGQILNQKVGEVSRTFAPLMRNGAGADDFAASVYGLRYEALMLQLPLARFTVGA